MRYYLLIAAYLLVCLLQPQGGHAQPGTDSLAQRQALLVRQLLQPLHSELDTTRYARYTKPLRRTSFFGAPALGYGPETSFLFGAFGVFSLRGKESIRPNTLSFYAIYTLENQFLTELEWDVMLYDGDVLSTGIIDYRFFPLNYWGNGPNTPDENEERYDPYIVRLDVPVLFRIWEGGSLYLGPRFYMDWYYRLDLQRNDGLLATTEVTGQDGGRALGGGLQLVRDTRDFTGAPTQGDYINLGGMYFGGLVGDFAFTRVEVDLRKYIPVFRSKPVNKRHVVALQTYAEFHGGNPPFFLTGLMGGQDVMRGYYRGRYRDNHLVTFQAEYRAHVWWRFSLAAWGGGGWVMPNLPGWDFSTFQYTVGGGGRLLVDKQNRIFLRADYGIGRGGNRAFYLSVGEAF